MNKMVHQVKCSSIDLACGIQAEHVVVRLCRSDISYHINGIHVARITLGLFLDDEKKAPTKPITCIQETLTFTHNEVKDIDEQKFLMDKIMKRHFPNKELTWSNMDVITQTTA